MQDLHIIQTQILIKLLYSPQLRYSELRPNEDIENNQLNFHIKQLIAFKLIEKVEETYQLTPKGKEFAGRLNDSKQRVEKQAKISAAVCCIRDTDNGEKEILIYTRLKHPFYGCQGFMSGKVSYGEMIVDAASRELKEETNLDGKAEIVEITHYHVIARESGELLEDKIMFCCVVNNPTGEIVASNEGKYEWISYNELSSYVTKPFEDYDSFIRQVDMIISFKGTPVFTEVQHISDQF